jgi:hypothetical protein
MSELSNESSLLALLRLYDQLLVRVQALEDWKASLEVEDEGEPTRYMDGTPIKHG